VARPVPVSADLPSDAASLPSIESITAETDIRGFLASGVPPELTRAALRRAWACDPNIRNFVGLADYDWDFNAAGSIAGFGPLQMTDDVAKMAARIVAPNPCEGGACDSLAPAPTRLKAEQVNQTTVTDTGQDAADETHDRTKFKDEPASETGVPPNPKELAHRGHGSAAAQDAVMKPEDRNVLVRQQHGRALPK